MGADQLFAEAERWVRQIIELRDDILLNLAQKFLIIFRLFFHISCYELNFNFSIEKMI